MGRRPIRKAGIRRNGIHKGIHETKIEKRRSRYELRKVRFPTPIPEVTDPHETLESTISKKERAFLRV